MEEENIQYLVEYSIFSPKRNFGVEIEFNEGLGYHQIFSILQEYEKSTGSNRMVGGHQDWAQSNCNNYWHIKTDSTCGTKGKGPGCPKGWEIASYVGKTIADMQNIAGLGDFLKSKGIEINNNCGFHVHVNVGDFSPTKIGLLLAFWLKIERMMLYVVPIHRRNNKYCKMLNGKKIGFQKQYTPDELWAKLKPTNLETHNNSQKKRTLNTVSYLASQHGYFNRPTVEFRFPEGTLNSLDIVNWIRLFVHFVNTVSKLNSMPANLKTAGIEECLTILGLRSNNDHCLILSKGLYATKMWFLDRLISFSGENYIVDQATEVKKLISDFELQTL